MKKEYDFSKSKKNPYSFENNVSLLIKALKQFEYKLDSVDHIWDIIFPDKKNKWRHLRVTKYHEVFYIALMDDDICTLEITNQYKVQAAPSFNSTRHDVTRDNPALIWNDLITYTNRWLNIVKKDWVKANKQAHETYPLNRRTGIIPNSLIRHSLSDIYRIDKNLGKSKTKKFIQLIETGYFRDREKTTRDSMTANDFFDYCKIAYLASQKKDENINADMTGREMYKCYADGRDEGLLQIAADSQQEFADWIDGKHPKKSMGGHPWEIKRGGNTTHIDLYVSRPSYEKDRFTITLNGPSIGRMKETICMFLGIYNAGLPITIADPEGIHKRLLAQDNIGVIPCFDSLHRADQQFHEHQHVYDVLHYDDLGKNKRRIKSFITWEPLPILKPLDKL